MKSITLLFALFPLVLFGQITVTQADFASAGDTVRVSTAIDPAIDFTTTGPNQNWDFSTLQANDQILREYNSMSGVSFLVQVAFGSFASTEYQASYYLPTTDIPLDQITGILPVNITDVFGFSRSTADSITSVGYAVSVDGNEIPFKSDTIETVYKFPLDYQDTYASSGYSVLDMNPFYNGIWKQYRTRNSEVDGWGTITTPYGTFDALRIKHSVTEWDSVYAEFGGVGTWIQLPIPDTYIYEWWTNNEKMPVLRISTSDLLGTETVTNIEYRDHYLGLDAGLDEKLISLEVYPNPATEEIMVKDWNTSGTYTILDASMKVIAEGEILDEALINVKDLAEGMYQLVLKSERGIGISSFIKK